LNEKLIFENQEEVDVCNEILALVNKIAERVDDVTVMRGALAAAALYCHHSITKQQIGLWVEADTQIVTAEFEELLRGLSQSRTGIPLAN